MTDTGKAPAFPMIGNTRANSDLDLDIVQEGMNQRTWIATKLLAAEVAHHGAGRVNDREVNEVLRLTDYLLEQMEKTP